MVANAPSVRERSLDPLEGLQEGAGGNASQRTWQWCHPTCKCVLNNQVWQKVLWALWRALQQGEMMPVKAWTLWATAARSTSVQSGSDCSGAGLSYWTCLRSLSVCRPLLPLFPTPSLRIKKKRQSLRSGKQTNKNNLMMPSVEAPHYRCNCTLLVTMLDPKDTGPRRLRRWRLFPGFCVLHVIFFERREPHL